MEWFYTLGTRSPLSYLITHKPLTKLVRHRTREMTVEGPQLSPRPTQVSSSRRNVTPPRRRSLWTHSTSGTIPTIKWINGVIGTIPSLCTSQKGFSVSIIYHLDLKLRRNEVQVSWKMTRVMGPLSLMKPVETVKRLRPETDTNPTVIVHGRKDSHVRGVEIFDLDERQ